MRILVAGTFQYPMYQEALCHGFECCGHKIIRLVLKSDRPYNLLLCSRNAHILKSAVDKDRPDAIFLYRVENIWSSCLAFLKKNYPSIPIAIYHNDDPFRKGFKRFIKSVHYLACVKYSDVTYVYRPVNIPEAYRWGAKNAKLLMSHYNSQTDLLELPDSFFSKKTDEVAFIGHYENDSRVDIIDCLFKGGINIHIYNDKTWNKCFISHNWPLNHLHPGASGDGYKALVQKVGIALAFYSSKNRDEYTRRCFEIPIMGTMIASPITAITKKIYKDGENALLFSSKEELLYKLIYYTNNPEEMNRVARNGYINIKEGGYSEIDRAKMIIEDIQEIINKNNI